MSLQNITLAHINGLKHVQREAVATLGGMIETRMILSTWLMHLKVFEWMTQHQSSNAQVGLQLSRDQETEILTARRRMLTRLLALIDQRKAIISQLGLQMLQTGRVSSQSPCSPNFGNLKVSHDSAQF